MAFRILSIDGGGARGIIPLTILSELEARTNRKIGELFDFIVGTSTGGLIACGLALHNDSSFVYSAQDLLGTYIEHVPKIFAPKYKIKQACEPLSYLRPLYNPNGLDVALENIFKNFRLSDCRKPVFISAYDLRNRTPIYFTSRGLYETGQLNGDRDILLKEICRATSAAPTYFPPYILEYAFGERKTPHHFVDGGIFLNNPSLAGYLEIIQNRTHPLYNLGVNDSVRILSLGTGVVDSSIQGDLNLHKAGKLGWAKPIVDLFMTAGSQAVDDQIQLVMSNTVLARIQPSLKKHTELDASSNDAIEYWTKDVVFKEVINNKAYWNSILSILH